MSKKKSKARTALTQKQYSPLVIRKITRFGFPIYASIITDDDLNRLDDVVIKFVKKHIKKWKSNSIQDKRWLAGALCDKMSEAFENTEGTAVVLYIDKTCISSLAGDFMNHAMCRQELYFLLNMGTAV